MPQTSTQGNRAEALMSPATVVERRGPTAGRYAPEIRLGQGGYATVFRCLDQVTGRPVALKRFRNVDPDSLARVRSEIAAMRSLRFPGVVRLLDEGIDEEGAYLVMDLVDGKPFPGPEAPVTWEQLRPTLLALLRILMRVHAAGVIHRDLKPGNVLVDSSGNPTVLDFGIARGSFRSTITGANEIIGTPAYLAPEQVTSDDITPAADLFAIGVMTYEALCGELPFPSHDARAAMFARVFGRHVPLREVAPHVPQGIAEIVEALLARQPSDRIGSARDLYQRLRLEDAGDDVVRPFLGSLDVVLALVEDALAGRSTDVVGPEGGGRTRCLTEVRARLHARGVRVLWIPPRRGPFASLAPHFPHAFAGDSLARLQVDLESALAHELSTGTVILADDLQRLDPYSDRLLRDARRSGSVVRALSPTHADASEATRLRALPAHALESLFSAPERIHHLRSDAAQALRRVSGGLPAAVFETLDLWLHAGYVTPHEGRYQIRREALERIEADASVPRMRSGTRSATPPPREELLAVYEVVRASMSDATLAQIAEVLREPRWRVEALCDELTSLGVLARGARIEALPAPWIDPPRSEQDRRALHLRVANVLPVGTTGRIENLLRAGPRENSELESLAVEATSRAERLGRAGHLTAAQRILADASAAIAAGPEEAVRLTREMFFTWTEVAFADGVPTSLLRLRHALQPLRADEASPWLDALRSLVDAGVARHNSPDRAREKIEALPTFAEPRLERRRFALRMFAARRGAIEAEEHLVEEAARRSEALADTEFEAERLGWLGRLHYRRSAHADAALAHEAAAKATEWATRRIENTVAAASAWMEGFVLDRAEELAVTAVKLAAEVRHPVHEARAEWVLRATRLRRGDRLTVDDELLAAVRSLENAEVTMLVTMCEAVVAWRDGDAARAIDLAEESGSLWRARGVIDGADLMDLFAITIGRPPRPGEVDAIADRIPLLTIPRGALQIRAIVKKISPRALATSESVSHALRGLTALPPHFRLDVLSIAEVLDLLEDEHMSPST